MEITEFEEQKEKDWRKMNRVFKAVKWKDTRQSHKLREK